MSSHALPRLGSTLTSLMLLMLAACSSAPPSAPAEAPVRQGDLRDFSGHWEKNYQLSDDFTTRFSLYVADIRRRLVAQGNGDFQGGPFISGNGLSTEAINGLAQFSEEITRMPLLEIIQNDTLVEVEREDDFTLRCPYADREFITSTNTFGNDACGWNDDRLMFRMSLAGGLNISHQFTLSPDATMLNVLTTVSTNDVSLPIVISNFYQRYEPTEENYNCVLTLTRNTVCNQNGTPR